MGTLVLIKSEVEKLLEPTELLPELRRAFVAYSASPNERARRVRSRLPGPGTATVLFPGVASGVPAYTVKVHAKFPDQRPAIRGVLCLHAAETGDLLAVMDSTYLTAVRTGLAGALAADVLARRDTSTAAVIGAGVQGRYQLRFLAELRPLTQAWVFDLVPERAVSLARDLAVELGFAVEPAQSVAAAVRHAGIVLTATWAREPFITPGMLAPGAHVTTLGPDEPGKAEVTADVIRNGLFVCDDRALAVEMGAVGGVGLGPDAIAAELGEVLGGVHPGRTSPEQVTIYGGVGLAFQDVLAAWAVYQAARLSGVGREIDFFG
jgi:ornithine cyclodeaminase/alanine dehydrogenase-like protein (mu-crystallin family)